MKGKRKVKRGVNGISLRGPIHVTPEIWFYENRTNIDVYLSREFVAGSPLNGVNFKIPRRKLASYLRQVELLQRRKQNKETKG